MKDILRRCQIFDGFNDGHLSEITTLAARRTLQAGEHLFRLGDKADRLFVVLEGTVELCLPLSIQGVLQEIVVQSEGPGGALGWSAFVKPNRFQLSARTEGPGAVAEFERAAVLRLIEADPVFGCAFFERIAEMIGRRHLTMEALWARELQRSVASGLHASREGSAG
jgi:CRP-like cAMP-binding protein